METLSKNVCTVKDMNAGELDGVAVIKRKNFNRRFDKQYGVKLLELQAHCNPQGECFVELDFLFGPRMTAEAIGMMCENVAAWIGGELRGTVNIDFSGSPTLSMVVEFPHT